MTKQPRGIMALLFAAPIILGVILIDQVTKYWALATLPSAGVDPLKVEIAHARSDFLPFIDLQFHINPNAALSIPIPGPYWVEILLIAFIIVMIAVWLMREGGRQNAIGFGLIIGGAIGNLIDRLLHRVVIDFLVPDFGRFQPFFLNFIFNIADAALTLGVIWLFVEQLILRPRRNAQAVVS